MTNGKPLVFSKSTEGEFTPFTPPVGFEEAGRRADEILSAMSLDEKISMISGENSFYMKGFARFGIPQLYLSDATQGVHIRHELPGQMQKSTAFPSPICLASTWNGDLADAYAEAVGEECRAGEIAVLLGPGMNIYRHAQCGRNFEYFGEDPYLVSRLIENYVAGMQRTGTIATLKHFLGNNTEYFRRWSNSIIGERAIHEIYTPAFKAGIDAGALSVMTSYNQLNGEWAGESGYVVTHLLREELGFKWLVMSDWWSLWHPEKAITSGLDLDMPGHTHENFLNDPRIGDVTLKNNAKRLLEEGRIGGDDIVRMATSILRTIIAAGLLDRPVRDESSLDNFAAHEALSLQTAREGIVLLKNDKGALPLGRTLKILLRGDHIENLAMGSGAAAVEGFDNVTLLEALSAEFAGNILYNNDPSDDEIASAEAVVFSVGTEDTEAWDHPFEFPPEIDRQILHTAKLNPRTIVIVAAGSGRGMSAWNDLVAAVIYCWYPGQKGYAALAEILSGRTNPSGKLPITIERKFEDSPGYGYIPEGERLYTGWPNDMSRSREVYDIRYDEDIFVGYRWYESKKISPLYAFGHGLSYTSFCIDGLKLSSAFMRRGDVLTIFVSITNTGPVAGAEVVQLYIGDVESSLPRPVKELKGFRKVGLIPGETKKISFRITEQDLAFWDDVSHCWKAEAGKFRVEIGSASDRICGGAEFDLL